MFAIIVVLTFALSAVNAFNPPVFQGISSKGYKVHHSLNDDGTLFLSELYSSPTAKYNGELISPSIKVVPVAPKPEGYAYGAVSDAAAPALLVGVIASIIAAAAVPAFLSIGESAKKQQAGYEDENRIGYNEFAIKARQEQKGKPSVVTKGAPAKVAAKKETATKPAAEVKKPSNPFNFFGKK